MQQLYFHTFFLVAETNFIIYREKKNKNNKKKMSEKNIDSTNDHPGTMKLTFISNVINSELKNNFPQVGIEPGFF